MIIKIILIPKKIYFNVVSMIIARKDTIIQVEHLVIGFIIIKTLLLIIIQRRLLTMVMVTNKVRLEPSNFNENVGLLLYIMEPMLVIGYDFL